MIISKHVPDAIKLLTICFGLCINMYTSQKKGFRKQHHNRKYMQISSL